MKKIALIDAYGFVFRAYHSLPPLVRKDNTPVGAVYGFTNMLLKLLASLNVSHIGVVFDSGGKNFRHDIYPQYKANRPPCPEDLKPQFSIIREATKSLNLLCLEKQGFEADDIIATLAKKSANEGFEVIIVSSDKDLMQLVDERISLYDAMKNKMINEQQVLEKFFVQPKQVLDILSLIGDASDNVPGVKGIGIKTASELINQYQNLENIFSNLTNISQEKRRELLATGHQNAILSKKLIALDENVELNFNLEDLRLKAIDPNKLINFLEQQNFRSLVLKVKKEFKIDDQQNLFLNTENTIKKSESPSNLKYHRINNSHQIDMIHSNALTYKALVVDYFIFDNQIDYITLSTPDNNGVINDVYFLKIINHQQKTLDLFSAKTDEPQPLDLQAIFKILEDSAIRKIFFKTKEFLRFLLNYNKTSENKIDLNKIVYDDVNLINYLLTSSSKNSLRELIDSMLETDLEELGYGKIFEDIAKEKIPEQFSQEQVKIDFLCFINPKIYQLYQILNVKLFENKLNNSYFSLQLPLIRVLAIIENNGIKIDISKLQKLSQQFAKNIAELSTQIYQIAGQEFNIASSQQLSVILFNKLGLPSSKKSKKTQNLSTSINVLEDLASDGFEIAKKIIEFRKFYKLKNTYADGLQKEINSQTQRIHSHFSNTATITGRLNSFNPNLQNLPIKTTEGKMIRQCFIPSNDHTLISADYSQIELRILADMANITNLIQAFKNNKDIHTITACEVFKISELEIDDVVRNKAKAINFGIIYGISAFGLAKQLKISNSEADQYIKSYFATYKGIEDHMKNSIKFAEENGFVLTISNRKIFIHDIKSKNPIIKNEAKRQAINAGIQGSCADIISKAMINITNKFLENNIKSKMVLQIHDELVFEVANCEKEIVKKIIKEEMENSYSLKVPMQVDLDEFI